MAKAARQKIECWVVPGEQAWTLVGLAEGSAGARTIADDMERSGVSTAISATMPGSPSMPRAACWAVHPTVAYDSAKQQDDQRVLGTIDPNAYYTVFADGIDRRFDAASREKLYVRVETGTSTRSTAISSPASTRPFSPATPRRDRRKGGRRLGALHVQGFAAKSPAAIAVTRSRATDFRPLSPDEPGDCRKQRNRGDRSA